MALSRCRGIAVPTSKTQAEKHAEERAKARNTCAGESAGQLQGPEAVNPLHLPLGFLEEIASGIDGFEGVVAMEAMEALLAVPPALVKSSEMKAISTSTWCFSPQLWRGMTCSPR
eukprot:symbB.v1.2.018089.t1/scaffold1431.1/size119194/3